MIYDAIQDVILIKKLEHGYYSLLIDKEYGDTFNIDRRSYIAKVKVILDLFEIHLEPHLSPHLLNVAKT